jgi:MFS family permease
LLWWHALQVGQQTTQDLLPISSTSIQATGGIDSILALPTLHAHVSPTKDKETSRSDIERRRYGLDELANIPRADREANIVTTLQYGYFVAALAAGILAENFGQRWSLITAALCAIVGRIMQAAAVGYLAPFFIGRFIAGLGVGSASMIAPLYGKNDCQAVI